jgi:hypothetical protein
VRDDGWGPPVSRVRRGAKATRLEALPMRKAATRWGGATDAQAGWADREQDGSAERPRPSGEGGKRLVEKKRRWVVAGPKATEKFFSK